MNYFSNRINTVPLVILLVCLVFCSPTTASPILVDSFTTGDFNVVAAESGPLSVLENDTPAEVLGNNRFIGMDVFVPAGEQASMVLADGRLEVTVPSGSENFDIVYDGLRTPNSVHVDFGLEVTDILEISFDWFRSEFPRTYNVSLFDKDAQIGAGIREKLTVSEDPFTLVVPLSSLTPPPGSLEDFLAGVDSIGFTTNPFQSSFSINEIRIVREPDLPGDFNANGVLDAADIDLLSVEVRAETNNSSFDLNADNLVNATDRTIWVRDLKRTHLGDADLDGVFGSADLVNVFMAGEYEDNILLNSTWLTGDWNGDAEFDSGDLVSAFQDGGYVAPAAPAIPEPTSFVTVLAGLIGLATVSNPRRNRV